MKIPFLYKKVGKYDCFKFDVILDSLINARRLGYRITKMTFGKEEIKCIESFSLKIEWIFKDLNYKIELEQSDNESEFLLECVELSDFIIDK